MNYNQTKSMKGYSVKKHDDHSELFIPIPGHNPDDIEIEHNGYDLLIKSKPVEKFADISKDVFYSFSINAYRDDYDLSSVKASVENGILIISIPKHPDKKPQKIKITGVNSKIEIPSGADVSNED